MPTKQQQESLDYFDKHAQEWRSKADGNNASTVNVIEERNNYVLNVAKERSCLTSCLDIGCGTGELVCEIGKLSVPAVGVDYSPEMIELAASKAVAEAVPLAKFECCSVFDYESQPNSFDLISANGFIEYISVAELDQLLDKVSEALEPGGSFVVGSRNRLFNLFSMNKFTLEEVRQESGLQLFEEAVMWNGAKDLSNLPELECAPLQPSDTEHSFTGIDVSRRFQYTPLQLIGMLREKGFEAVEVYPVHIHGATPSFQLENPATHTAVANLLQTQARGRLEFLTHASTFMLHVRKES